MGQRKHTGEKKLESAEDELKRVNRFLDAIVENIPDMIFVKEAKTLLFERFNRAGEELLGWKREELLGKTDHDFYPKEQADFFHLKDRETLAKRVLVDVPEEPIETKGKGLRWLHTRKVPVFDENGTALYLLGISEDITVRKAAEELARALERELASVVKNAKDAIISWRPDGSIVSWNAAAEALYGLSAQEAVGSGIERIVPEWARAPFRAAQTAALGGAQVPVADTIRLRSGQEIELEESLFLIRDFEGHPARIGSVARDVSEVGRLRRATQILGATEAHGGEEDSKSKSMCATLAAADTAAADPKATVLLLGETGVGKGWLARRVHARSPRASKPFFEINCASLGEQLVESELFGHERGAFTGAQLQKRGLVEVAEGGTLFLDEIGELSPGVQAQVLTFLDSRTFRRVGGTRVMKADVRILAATNVDLKGAADAGAFRKDLYYRLSVFPIEVPPLRQRDEDIPHLARTILAGLSRSGHRRAPALDRSVIAALKRHLWPGNVRELRNVLERALIVSHGAAIGTQHLPPELTRNPRRSSEASLTLEDIERRHIERVLEGERGNRTKAAEVLGISRSTLKRKLAEMARDHEP